jgi:hypothetical protein
MRDTCAAISADFVNHPLMGTVGADNCLESPKLKKEFDIVKTLYNYRDLDGMTS